MERGRYIALEGSEGTGKSTHARHLANELGAVVTREHGGTPIGLLIRNILADPAHTELTAKAEALLIAADRAQHLDEVVRAGAGGRTPRGERPAASTRPWPTRASAAGCRWRRCGPSTSGPSTAAGPTSSCCSTFSPISSLAGMRRRELDRFERSGPEFYQRVADGFRALAAEDPERWVVVDGNRSLEDVAAAIRTAVRDRLGL